MMNGSLIFKIQQDEVSRNKFEHSQTLPEKKSKKNQKLALNYYTRVSQFAKEQLVSPQNLVIQTSIPDLKPAFSTRSISHYLPQSTKSSNDLSQPFRQDQPMLFGSFRTGTERLVSEILKNQTIDTSPSKKVIFGNEISLLNLRPPEPEKNVGRTGRFRQKGHSGEQDFLDRISKNTPVYLSQDLKINKASSYQMAESDVKARLAAIELEGLSQWQKPLPKKHIPFVAHPELHKKTYFNAVQKLLTTPESAPLNQNEIDPKSWGSAKILENSIKHPPQAYSAVGAAKLMRHHAESEWYDNFIEPQNMITQKALQTSEVGVAIATQLDQIKTSPTAILQQVLRQCGHSQRPIERKNLQVSASRVDALKQMKREIRNFGDQNSPSNLSIQKLYKNDSISTFVNSQIGHYVGQESSMNLPQRNHKEFIIESESIQRL